jgi:hypothetical protein
MVFHWMMFWISIPPAKSGPDFLGFITIFATVGTDGMNYPRKNRNFPIPASYSWYGTSGMFWFPIISTGTKRG